MGMFGWGGAQQASSLRGAKRRSNPDFLAPHDGLLRCTRNDGGLRCHSNLNRKHGFTISRPDLPEACYRISLPSKQRAQGMPGARCTRGLVCKSVQKGAHEHTGSAEASDIPCAMVLRLISCSPRRAGLVVTVARGIALDPIGSMRNHELDASIGASGPHDFAVRIRAVRQRHIRVHRIPSRACDDRETPLVSGRDQIAILLIWVRRQTKFLKNRNLPELQSSRFTLQVTLLYACPRQSAHAARDRSDCPWANWCGSGRE